MKKKRVHNKSTGRDYTKDKLYNKKTIKQRSQRNKARRDMEVFLTKKYGPKRASAMMKNKDVDHAHPISKGGTNKITNLRLQSKAKNRARINL